MEAQRLYFLRSLSWPVTDVLILKAFNRWVVPELASTIRSLKEAREHRNASIKSFRTRVYAEFDADRSVYLRAIRVLSELDCLFSLARSSVALGEPSCRPEFIEGDSAFIDFEELRHPALSVSAGFRGDFIPNDVKLGGDVARIALLTGAIYWCVLCISVTHPIPQYRTQYGVSFSLPLMYAICIEPWAVLQRKIHGMPGSILSVVYYLTMTAGDAHECGRRCMYHLDTCCRETSD